jgi:hypothetical protein
MMREMGMSMHEYDYGRKNNEQQRRKSVAATENTARANKVSR